MVQPLLDCKFTDIEDCTVEGDKNQFGLGVGSVTVIPAEATEKAFSITIGGPIYRMKRVKFTSTIEMSEDIIGQLSGGISVSGEVTSTFNSETGLYENLVHNISPIASNRSFITITIAAKEESDTSRVFNKLEVLDVNGNSMNMEGRGSINYFELPRLDWYDDEGRIYKDALIENFNALEAKLNEINSLSAFSSEVPDISNLSLDPVTLEDEDNMVVSLESFLDIFDLINYPVELTFDGTKIRRLAYWDENKQYIERANLETGASLRGNRYIFYNFSTKEASSRATPDIGENETLLGCYLNGKVITVSSPYTARLNLMYLLANMNTKVKKDYVGPGYKSDNIYFPSDATGKQQSAILHCESKAGKYSRDMQFFQTGRREKEE